MPDQVLPRSDEADAIKGLLVLLVVVGHDTLLTTRWPEVFPILYNFHVAVFLIAPVVFKAHPISIAWVRDRVVRYFVPYAAFAIATAVIWRVSREDRTPLWAWATKGGLALVWGNHDALKEFTGFSLFWFLPVLFSLAAMRAVVARYPRQVLAFAALALVVHCSCGLWPDSLRYGPPMGVVNALFVLPLAAAVGWLWPRVQFRPSAQVLALGIAVVTSVVALEVRSVCNVGSLQVPAANEPLRLLLHDVLIVSAAIGVFGLGKRIARWRAILAVGNRSLPIYLTHSLALHGYLFALAAAGVPKEARLSVPLVALSVLVMAGGSFALAGLLQGPKIGRWLFPRDMRSWPMTRPLFSSASSDQSRSDRG